MILPEVHIDVDEGIDAPIADIRQAVVFALEHQKSGESSLSVKITTAEVVHQLNREFAGNDYPTDVLSFAAEDEPFLTDDGELPYLGDIVIAYSIAVKQAAETGWDVRFELQKLVVHGVLHLLGYDHGTSEDSAEMMSVQEAVLNNLQKAS